jgi:hypothetical protein
LSAFFEDCGGAGGGFGGGAGFRTNVGGGFFEALFWKWPPDGNFLEKFLDGARFIALQRGFGTDCGGGTRGGGGAGGGVGRFRGGGPFSPIGGRLESIFRPVLMWGIWFYKLDEFDSAVFIQKHTDGGSFIYQVIVVVEPTRVFEEKGSFLRFV